MTALETELTYRQAEEALENAEAFELTVREADNYAADDMPADMRERLNELLAYAERDTQEKRLFLGEV